MAILKVLCPTVLEKPRLLHAYNAVEEYLFAHEAQRKLIMKRSVVMIHETFTICLDDLRYDLRTNKQNQTIPLTRL